MERRMSERARHAADQWFAAILEDEAKLDELVSQGVNLDLQVELELGSASVLHVLAIRGSIPAIELLIRKEASIDIGAGEDANTALHFAALCGHATLVQRLVALGANVYARTSCDGKSSTPLHFVAYFGKDSISSVQILGHLLTHGGASDLFIDNADGDTALHCAAFNKTISHIMIKEVLCILSTSSSLSVSSVINRGNKLGQTAFHYAVCNDCPESAADLLWKAGASKDACDAYGATPFHYAARSGNVHVLEMLRVENQLDILDAPATKNHFTALHYAAWNQRHEAVEWLLEHGASVNVTDTYKGNEEIKLFHLQHIHTHKKRRTCAERMLTRVAD